VAVPLFYLSYRAPDGAFIGAAIVDSLDHVQARAKANAEGLDAGGFCIVNRLSQRVPRELIGRKLTRTELEQLIETDESPPELSGRGE
jgi:hypothetical protein